jgi:FKBP12-rapamycin complex-associated protein
MRIGHLVRAGGTLATDIVEFDMKRALEWLQGDRSEQRRYAAGNITICTHLTC